MTGPADGHEPTVGRPGDGATEFRIVAALLVVTFIAFAPSLSGDFVYDDHRFIPENAAIRHLGNAGRFFTDIRTMTATQGVPGWDDIYRPLRTLAFAVDWSLFGPRAVGYRMMSILWHLVAVWLAFRLARRLLRRTDLAAIAAGVFALHPLQTQSVAWISSRGDLMAAVFLLGAALMLLREDPGWGRGIAGIGLYVLALLSKESAVAFVALVVFHDLLLAPRRRFRFVLVAGLVAPTILFLVIRSGLATGQQAFTPAGLMGAGSATVVLLGEILLPVRLLPYTGDVLIAPRVNVWPGAVALAIAAGVVVVALVRGRRAPRVAFAALWTAACLAPVSGLVPLKSLAESRFAYLPLVGVGLGVALLVERLGRRGLVLGVATLGLLAVATFGESRVWTSDAAIWKTATTREKDYGLDVGDIAWGNYAITIAEEGDHAGAIEAFRMSLSIRPTAETWANLAKTLSDVGRREEAVEAARTGVRLDPTSVPARDQCGHVLLLAGDTEGAIKMLEDGVALAPDYARIRARLGMAYREAGRIPDAILTLRLARRLDPDSASIELDLGRCLAMGGYAEDAVAAYERSFRLDPANPVPLLLAGRTLVYAELIPEGAARFQRALGIRPDFSAARAELMAAISLLEGGFDAAQMAEFVAAVDDLEESGDLQSAIIALLRPGIWGLEEYGLRSRAIRLLFATGGHAEAERRLVEMKRKWPENSDIDANLGIARLELGRPGEAVADLEAALARSGGTFVIHYHLALAHRALGHPEEARRAASKAVATARSEMEKQMAREILDGPD